MSKFSLREPLGKIQYPNDFSFYVGQTVYRTSRVLVAIRCSKIRLLILSDPTAEFIVFPFDDPDGQFATFVQYIHNGRIRIDADNMEFLSLVANFFGCDELISDFSDMKQSILTPERVFQTVLQAQSPAFYQAEIRYLAENFPMLINRPEFCNIPFCILDAVLAYQNFCSEGLSESDIFGFISNVVAKRGVGFVSLFANVVFENLERNAIEIFLAQVPREEISGALWSAIVQRLVTNVSVPDE